MTQVIILKIHKGNKLVEERRIRNTPVVLGSSDVDSHVVLRGDVSPIHARIEKRGDDFLICDLGSERGTFKNLDKILEAQLHPGDTITLGEFSLEFSLAEETEEEKSSGPLEAHLKKEEMPKQTPDVSLGEEEQKESSEREVTLEKSDVESKETASEENEKLSSLSSAKNTYTFAPSSPYKNVDEFIKPSKGPTVEVLVAWRERIISAHHFSKSCSVVVGIDPSCDVVVPLIASNVSKAPLIQISNQARISLFPGMEGVLITGRDFIDFNQLTTIGRGSDRNLVLKQNEMVRIQLGGELELVIRYSPQAPKAVIIPFMDLSSNGFLAVLLALVLSGILMLWVALNRLDKIDRPDEEEYRTALIITNPPPPPPPEVLDLKSPKIKKPKKPSKEKPKKLVKKEKPKKEKPKKKGKKVKNKIKMDLKEKERKRVTSKNLKNKQPKQAKQGKKNQSVATTSKVKSSNKSKAKNMGSVKKGGSVKNTNKKGAQMQSEKNLKKSGIFSAFGSGGKNNRLDQSYGGRGELAGLANKASGSAGFAEDRPGEGLGSKFKDTGGYKSGSNVGVTRLKRNRKKNSLGGITSSLGDRKTMTIIPGGGDEEFSGQIDREGIRRVFIDNQRVLRSCYERELNKNPSLSGIIRLNFDIGRKGRVVGRPSVNWGDSSMKSRSMGSCILNRLKSWRFPEPPSNEIVNVIYPLAFSAR